MVIVFPEETALAIPKSVIFAIRSLDMSMQKTPDRRYLSMRQLVTELDALLVDPNGVFGIIDTGYREETPNVSFRQDPSYDRIDDIEKSA